MMKQTRNHRKLVRLFCMLVIAALFAVALPAQADTQGRIRNPNGGSYVNVRSWASFDADILTRVNVGITVTITGTSGAWYSVWVDGLTGYIHSNFVSTSGGGSTTATVVGGALNLREAPSMRARVIMSLPTGTRVSVLAQEGTWAQVQAGNTVGYVVSSYLNFGGVSPTPTTNAIIRTNGSNLNLRSAASSSASIIGSFPNNYRIRVISQDASWCYVQAGNSYGYMSARYIARDGGGGNTHGYSAVVSSAQSLNLREQPSTSGRVLGSYRNGTSITVLGVGTEWHRVNVSGVQGYMMAKYIRITSSGATPHKTVTGGANGFVNLRSGPGYDYGILRGISNGSAASVVIPYSSWSKVLVRYGSGYESGYMLNSFLH